MSFWRPTITGKFVLLLIGFLVLQAGQLGIGILGILDLGAEASFIRQVGLQHTRTLLIANLGRQLQAASPQRASEARAALHAAIADYDAMAATRLPELGSSAKQAPAEELWQEAAIVWAEELRPLVVGTDGAITAAALASYERRAVRQLYRINRVVDYLEQDVRDQSRSLAILQAAVLALGLLLGVMGLWMARHVVSIPMRRLIDATNAIAAGAYDRRVPVSSRDEIGELAGTFNRMATTVGDKTARIRALNDVAVAVTACLGLPATIERILHDAPMLAGAQAVGLALRDTDARTLARKWWTRGLPEGFQEQPLPQASWQSGAGVAVAGLHAGATRTLTETERSAGFESVLGLLLTSGAHHLGVLYLYRRDSGDFSRHDTDLLVTFAHIAAGALDNALHFEVTLRQATTDKLTGLDNRRQFDQRLADETLRARRYNGSYCLLLIDIDHFKQVNDTHGHPAGDAVLKTLAVLFGSQVRDVDTVARFGGEEFALILPETEAGDARRLGERIRQSVADHPFTLPDGERIAVTVSIGIAAFPGAAREAADVVAHADQALYAAKEGGRNRVVWYGDVA